ncbi:N-acetylmuramoyl-L-alanine amidase [Paratissierella segnis]|uniref:N-acetylmuramoyl-L-alanine amidase n=1 Tax=Paratissierella segnis TaxID=2763679 RepID=A0A926ERD5_9FIRM|nr:N-acetylmuramoyl-L-alanine amidase [Paratissierella segnis]MBC8587120.1 N-acetylmuramoyl-L-alanine amidase [Paratissierella segnis]
MKIRKLLINKNYTKDKTITPRYIVIHYTASPGGSAYNHYVYFNREYVGASAHYFVDTKEIVQILEDSWWGWHCGAKSYKHPYCRNSNSIGIEMCIEKDWTLTDTVVNKTIELTKMLMKKYNIPIQNVLRHYDVTGKNCPAPFVQNPERWQNFLARLMDTEDIQKVNKKMQVTATALNVRTTPIHGAVLGTLKNGEIINVTGIINNWYQFTYKNQVAYCSGVYLKEYIEPKSVTSTLYKVQCGAFSVHNNAKNLESKLKKDGYSTYIVNVIVNGRNLYRVQCGAFSVKDNAINLQNKLKKDGYNCFITTN